MSTKQELHIGPKKTKMKSALKYLGTMALMAAKYLSIYPSTFSLKNQIPFVDSSPRSESAILNQIGDSIWR